MRSHASWLFVTLGVNVVFLSTVVGCSDDSETPNDVQPSSTFASTTEASGESTEPGTVASDDGGVGDAGEPEPNADELFDFPHVPVFDFELPADVWADLQKNARDEQYAEAQMTFEGAAFGNVGLRFKGYYGSLYGCFDDQGEMICPRLSMKVKFNEYVDDQRFYGLKRLNFNAYRHDDSRMKEKLTYELYREMDVVAPRASWAVVRVNGESFGLFGMVEQIDGRFTANRWPEVPNGNLYKEVWPTEAEQEVILDALDTNEEVGDVSAFLAFAQALTTSAEADARSTLGRYMDLDYLARYMAVDDATANYDGITYFWTDGASSFNHNFYIYEAAPTRFTLIPWDVEATFWINPEHAAPHWTALPEDCAETYPYWEGQASAPGCNRFFSALQTDLSGWRAASQRLLDGPFSVESMSAKIDAYEAFISEEAHADPTPNMYTTFDFAVAGLRQSVPELRARLEALIAE